MSIAQITQMTSEGRILTRRGSGKRMGNGSAGGSWIAGLDFYMINSPTDGGGLGKIDMRAGEKTCPRKMVRTVI